MSRCAQVPFSQANHSVRIPDPAGRLYGIGGDDVQHQYFGAVAVDPGHVAFPCVVQEYIARLHPMTAGIAGFHVTSGEHDRGKGMVVQMAGESFAGRVPQSAWLRVA